MVHGSFNGYWEDSILGSQEGASGLGGIAPPNTIFCPHMLPFNFHSHHFSNTLYVLMELYVTTSELELVKEN